ncbi:MAG TPA: tetratricopeptide repeat protein [Kofleriaceae bacterium]|nr:tetratricopeptide repeat protein [Kofleriaceae bacterium]
MLLLIGVAAALIIARPASVAAQPARGAPAPTAADKAAAKQLVNEGIAAQDQKDYDRAIELYQKAYALVPHPLVLFNIAQAHRLAGRLDEAVRLYEQYLAADPNGTQAELAREILASIKSSTTPAQPAQPAPPTTPAAPPPANEAPRAPSVSMQVDAPARPGRTLRIAGIAAGGVGVACAGAALAFGLRLESIEKEQLKRRDQGLPYEPDRVSAGQASERNQYIAAALAGTFVVGGAVLYWVGHRQGRDTPTTAWMPMVGSDVAGITMTGVLP